MLKKILLGIIGLLLILVLGFYFVGRRIYSDYVKQQIISAAVKQRMALKMGDLDMGLFGGNLSSWSLSFPKFFTSIDGQNFKASISPTSLLSLSPDARIDGTLYQGTLRANAQVSFSQKLANASVFLEHMQLKAHPMLAFVFPSGELNIKAESLTIDEQGPKKGHLRFELNEASINAYTIPKFLLPVPIDIKIPKIMHLEAALECTLDRPDLNCPTLNTSSSLARVTGSAQVKLDANQRVNKLSANFAVHLSDSGVAFIGPYLPLVSGGTLTNTDTDFTMSLTNENGMPQMRFKKVAEVVE